MSLSLTHSSATRGRAQALVPLCLGAGAYLLFLYLGDALLKDSDSFWQIKIGQWILDHHALPYTDFYSFTHFGEPWISTSWLSQVLFAIAHAQLDWAGPVILSSLAIAIATAIFVYRLDAHLEPARSVLVALLALALSTGHMLARPHILALPVMVAWIGALMAAADRRGSPSWLWLPLMALWANLHGGFVLGLALIAPIALEAVWEARADRRIALGLRWMLFGVGALIASCCTPYGWKTLLGAANILSLGRVLSLIGEWQASDFSSFTPFEGALLGLIAFGFYRGLVISPPRILLVLGLIWMALTHVRNIEIFAFLVPLVLAKPLGSLSPSISVDTDAQRGDVLLTRHVTALAAVTIVIAAWASTSIYLTRHRFTFTTTHTPVAAVDLLKQQKAQRVFNAYEFGGYLISRDIPVFIDGRAELYGESFEMDFYRATHVPRIDNLEHLLETYRIDTTLLVAKAAVAQVMDHLKGWKRLYADDIAVVHVRDDRPNTAPVAAGSDEQSVSR